MLNWLMDMPIVLAVLAVLAALAVLAVLVVLAACRRLQVQGRPPMRPSSRSKGPS